MLGWQTEKGYKNPKAAARRPAPAAGGGCEGVMKPWSGTSLARTDLEVIAAVAKTASTL